MSDAVRQSTPGPRTAQLELITFRVGAQDFCVDATHVKEMRGWTLPTLLPDSPAYVCGAINLRGAILPVVDLAARLELAPIEATARHVIIVVWIGKRLVGLVVEAVCDILAVWDEALQPTPNLKSDTMESLIAGLVTVGDRMVGLLNLDHVLPTLDEPVP